MSTIPDLGQPPSTSQTSPASDHDLDTTYRHAQLYIARGWPVFVLGRDKTPLALCDSCRHANYLHDRVACDCLTCHGFYAATLDLDRVARMIALHPTGQLAVATGYRSNLVVIDVEAAGVDDVLHQWESWVGGWSLPPTLTALTEHGGVHLFFDYSSVGVPVRQQIRPLPEVDVKASGGYVAVPSGLNARHWVDFTMQPSPVSPELATWLTTRRHRVWSSTLDHRGIARGGEWVEPPGYDYEHALENGPNRGTRDHFFNDMIYRMRVAGKDQTEIREATRTVWELMRDGNDFPWEWVEYKIDRVVATVALGGGDGLLGTGRRSWVAQMIAQSEPSPVPPPSGSTIPTIVRQSGRTRVYIVDPKDKRNRW